MTTTLDDDVWTARLHPHAPKTDDRRSPYGIDYARVVHSEAFRRLSGVVQIIGLNESSFQRNRLTHTIEVGQVALGIVEHLRATAPEDVVSQLPSDRLMQTVSAIHDIGHPPYGHGGEVALNYCMRDAGGFEGNGQTLRLMSKLVEGSSTRLGANLTRATLLGALKYPVAYSSSASEEPAEDIVSPINGRTLILDEKHEPPKCYLDTEQDVVDWLLSPFSSAEREAIVDKRAQTLVCNIMDVADECSYGIHDLEDAVILGFLTRDDMTYGPDRIDPQLWSDYLASCDGGLLSGTRYEAFLDRLFGHATKSEIGNIVHYAITNTYVRTREGDFETPQYRHQVSMRPHAAMLVKALKKLVMNRVILSPKVQQLRFKGQHMICDLFAYYQHSPRTLLPAHVWPRYEGADGDPIASKRVICDHIAGMTDDTLVRSYRRLADPGYGSVFDSLR